jgi:hypothetical protein
MLKRDMDGTLQLHVNLGVISLVPVGREGAGYMHMYCTTS